MMTEEKIFLIKRDAELPLGSIVWEDNVVELTKEEIEHLILELYPDIENPCSKCDNILKKLESLNG